MSARNGYFALALFLFSFSSFAYNKVPRCKLEGKITITEATEFYCDQAEDLVIEKDTTIVSNGNFVKIHSIQVDKCIVDKGLIFKTSEGDTGLPGGKGAKMLKFEAACITGSCASIHNDPNGQGFGAPVVYNIAFGYKGYKCNDISPQDKIAAFENGHLPISLEDFYNSFIKL